MNDPNDPKRDERPTAAIRPSGTSTAPGRVKDVARSLRPDAAGERYQRRKLLGRGGIGEVHLCHDRHIGRDVAMKLLRPATEDTSFSSATVRFLREARVQGQLEHPAIVPVYELGVTPDGVEYFTMKRIGGQTLESILHGLRTGESTVARAHPRNKLLQIFRQVCLAVEYAHVRGVVHRDLKPANIMVGHYGEVYVLDWGIAKVMAGEGSTIHPGVPEERTLDGQILGTVGYMPPEQLVGDPRLDARADVYALGAMLFEILTLQPLHQGHSAAELMRSTQIGANARAAERAPEREVPPELERMCIEATHLRPDQRLDGARALAEGADRFLEGDRDIELRRKLAQEHARAAEGAAQAALAHGDDAGAQRSRALQEAGRALALDPTSTDASRVVMRLMVQPPARPPASARDAIAREENEEARVALRFGGGAYLAVAVLAALGITAAGVQSTLGLAAIVAPVLLGALVARLVARRQVIAPWQGAIVVVLGFASISAASGLGGPLLFVPGLAAANVMATSIGLARPYRILVLSLACLALVVPFALDRLELIPPAYVHVDGGMMLLPRIMAIPPWIEPVALGGALVGIVVVPAFVIWRIGDQLTQMRQRIHTQSWQLQQLVPAEAGAAPEITPAS